MWHTVSPTGTINQDIRLSWSSACLITRRDGKQHYITNAGARLDEA